MNCNIFCRHQEVLLHVHTHQCNVVVVNVYIIQPGVTSMKTVRIALMKHHAVSIGSIYIGLGVGNWRR